MSLYRINKGKGKKGDKKKEAAAGKDKDAKEKDKDQAPPKGKDKTPAPPPDSKEPETKLPDEYLLSVEPRPMSVKSRATVTIDGKICIFRVLFSISLFCM